MCEANCCNKIAFVILYFKKSHQRYIVISDIIYENEND